LRATTRRGGAAVTRWWGRDFTLIPVKPLVGLLLGVCALAELVPRLRALSFGPRWLALLLFAAAFGLVTGQGEVGLPGLLARAMPSFFMRWRNVAGFMPSLSAAPELPSMTQ
jgi:hypothetical protein